MIPETKCLAMGQLIGSAITDVLVPPSGYTYLVNNITIFSLDSTTLAAMTSAPITFRLYRHNGTTGYQLFEDNYFWSETGIITIPSEGWVTEYPGKIQMSVTYTASYCMNYTIDGSQYY